MRKIAIIALVCILVGGAIGLVSWGLGATTSISWNSGFQLTDRTTVENLDLSFEPFTEILVDLDVVNVIVTHGDDYALRGRYHGTFATLEVQNGRLVVRATPANIGFNFSFFNFGNRGRNQTSELTITVPEDVVLESLHVTVGVGNVRVSDVEALEVELLSGVGNVVANGVAFTDVSLSSGVGNVEASGVFYGALEAQSGVGNVVLVLHMNEDEVTYNASVGVGRVTANDERRGTSDRQTATNEAVRLDLSSGTGNVTLSIRGRS